MIAYAWVIPALPLAAFLVNTFFGRRLGRGAAWPGVIALGLAFLGALWTLAQALAGQTGAASFTWLQIGDTAVRMGFRAGPLEAVMLAMVTLVSWMVEIYSIGYMHGDARYNRFFGAINLFVFAMLALVIADNFLFFLIAWEIMGLCSYLLIGHWFEDLDNARAANKAFLTTRLGDVGFMLGIWLLWNAAGTFDFAEISSALANGTLAGPILTLIALLLFAGAVGKSAQLPLHVWLPDAMAGPTPVSALIHAATMVAAGVFLVARAYPIFQHAPAALLTVAVIGGCTAFLAATIATVQEDIKKTLAYSTISQLGYMMLSLGLGGFLAGLFHLITHAFFKALLFLGSGSVIHGTGTQNMHEMGGLFSKQKLTAITFIVGTLALAGIPPFAGYFSKDEILLTAYASAYRWLFWLGVAAAFLTAYYMARAVVLTFFGRPRRRELYEHAHESPPNMAVPLVVLAIPAFGLGWLGSASLNRPFQHFLEAAAPSGEAAVHGGLGAAAYWPLVVSLAGLVAGVLLYTQPARRRAGLIRALRPVYWLFKQKWYFDHLAAGVTRASLWLAAAVGGFDRLVIDGAVNGAAFVTGLGGRGLRQLATGSVQAYMLTIFTAVVLGILVTQVMGG